MWKFIVVSWSPLWIHVYRQYEQRGIWTFLFLLSSVFPSRLIRCFTFCSVAALCANKRIWFLRIMKWCWLHSVRIMNERLYHGPVCLSMLQGVSMISLATWSTGGQRSHRNSSIISPSASSTSTTSLMSLDIKYVHASVCLSALCRCLFQVQQHLSCPTDSSISGMNYETPHLGQRFHHILKRTCMIIFLTTHYKF